MRISDWSSDVCSSDLVGALARAVRPQAEQRADVLDREAEIARVGDEAQAVDVGLRIVAIAAVAARRRRDQADLLVMADHPLRDRARLRGLADIHSRSEEHTSELQSLMRISYAVFCLKKKTKHENHTIQETSKINHILMTNEYNHKSK